MKVILKMWLRKRGMKLFIQDVKQTSIYYFFGLVIIIKWKFSILLIDEIVVLMNHFYEIVQFFLIKYHKKE